MLFLQDLMMAAMASASPQVLANSVYAVGKMKLQPPLLNTSFLSSLLTQSRQQLPAFIPQALSNSIWGLARIGYSPDLRWMADFIEESFLKLPLFNAQVRHYHYECACIAPTWNAVRYLVWKGAK
jgi:hypothetical protein